MQYNIDDSSLRSGSCGGGHLVVRDGGAPGMAEKSFFYGFAPYGARRVVVLPEGTGRASTVPTHPVSASVGAFYFASVDQLADRARVTPIDRDGRPMSGEVVGP